MSEDKAITRLDSMPLELLNKIYKYFFEVDHTRFDLEKTKYFKKVTGNVHGLRVTDSPTSFQWHCFV